MLRRVVASLSVVAILACGGAGGTVNPAWAAYREAAVKILGEYDLAMNDVATIDAALVDLNGGAPKITTDTAVSQIEAVVIPKLARVASSAAALQTPDYPTLTEAHKPLVAGLTGKVAGYKAMMEAYKKRDSAAFDSALKTLLTSDAQVKRYRANFQQWTEQGDVTLVAEAPATAAPTATSAGVGLIPGSSNILIPLPPQ